MLHLPRKNFRKPDEKISQKEIQQYYPKPGWVEHDPKEIWSSQLAVTVEAMAKAGVNAEDVAAIGITNQRETTVMWDKNTGLPVYHAIVWQSRQTSDIVNKFKEDGLEPLIKEETGLVLDPYFSASKIKWIRDNYGDSVKVGAGNVVDEDGELIYRVTKRGAKGVLTLKDNEKIGKIVDVKCVKGDEDLLAITSAGIVIRIHLSEVRLSGRNTQGVKLINLEGRQKVSSIAIVPFEEESDEEEPIEGEEEAVADENTPVEE